MSDLASLRADLADWKAYAVAIGGQLAMLRKQSRAADPFMWIVTGDGRKLSLKQAYFVGYSRIDAEEWIAKMREERPDLVFSDPVPLYLSADSLLIGRG